MGAENSGSLRKITNFGGNQGWYSTCYTPASETELLEILERDPGLTIRAIGSGHSWSDTAANSDIALDMSAFNSVTPIRTNGQDLVRVGAGCRLQDLLDRLHAATDRTLPTLGAIKKQTISGAISTATHGSGRQSLSHFVAALRMVVFDASGHPVIREFTEGAELLAGRCGLGCAGIILSVDLHTVPKYLVKETLRFYESVEQIIAAFAEHPLSHFGLWPYGWKLTVFERKPIDRRLLTLAEKANALFFRLFNWVCADFIFNLLVVISRWVGPRMIKAVQRFTPYTFAPIKDRERIDDAEHVLTSRHYLFRHEEMEMFVAESDFKRAIDFVRASVESFAGIDTVFPAEFFAAISQLGLDRELAARRGSYTHHYPLFCRRIPPEETLISMTALATEPMFSISIFTYDPPGRRDAYYAFCSFLAHALRKLVDARLHWGKHFPFDHEDIAPLYPRLEEFRALCHSHDRNGVLRNGYTGRVLNLPPGPAGKPAG
jgi:FAD/FMN-containing dehydrogenase